MNSFRASESSNRSNSGCTDVRTMAERELFAFFRAVTELFGSEEAELAAKDWVHELNESHSLPGSAREWRWITAKVSSRIAGRVHASSLLTETQSV